MEAPSGGPIDREAPRVAAISPDSAAVSADPDTISLLFSKEMDKRSVRDWTFFAPPLPPERRSWTGRRLDIVLAERLPERETVTILLGEEVKDKRGNPLGPWQAAFSTGPELDDGVVEGTVRGGRLKTGGVYLYVWSAPEPAAAADASADLPPPLRIGQADRTGRYRIEAVPRSVPLRICAHYDSRRNRSYDPEEDLLGCTEEPLRLDDTTRVLGGVDLYLVLPDEPGTLAGTVVDSSCVGTGEEALRRLAAESDSLRRLLDPAGEAPGDLLLGFQEESPQPVDTLAARLRLARIDSLRLGARADSARCAAPIVVRLLDSDSTLVEEIRGGGTFRFSAIPPGTYRIDAFRDRDADGRAGAAELRGAYPHAVELLPGRSIEKLDFPLAAGPP